MDELPRDAKSILELAKGAQPGADGATRERVRGRVEAAIAASASSHGEQPSLDKLGGAKSWLTSSKITLASTILLIGGGGALWATQRPGAAEDSATVAVAAAAELPEEPPARAGAENAARVPTPPAERSTSPVQGALPAKTATSASAAGRHALAAELQLLAQAADALASRDVSRARSALSEHRKRFRRPQLREERDGLSVLARCIENSDHALDEALAFVRKSPSSMLATRIKRACGLSDGT